jgi:hypothetical protein
MIEITVSQLRGELNVCTEITVCQLHGFHNVLTEITVNFVTANRGTPTVFS